MSWLTFLHIPDRETLYGKCFDALKPGGGLYAEDFFAIGELSEAEKESLSRNIYCDHSPTMDDYRDQFEAAGFIGIEIIDLTPTWSDFILERAAGYRANRARNLELHGAEVVDGLEGFYTAVERLFRGGNWGGLQIEAWKPG